VTALAQYLTREKPLYIDMERVNRESRDQELEHAEDDATDICKARVKRRMRLGSSCKEKPLYNGKVLAFDQNKSA
jgi:hypothetical protein